MRARPPPFLISRNYEPSQSGMARRWSFLQWRDHNRLACALDNCLQLVLLRLRHPELVQGLLKIAHKDLPFVRRDHQVPMGVPHRTTRVLLRAAGGLANHLSDIVLEPRGGDPMVRLVDAR